MCFAISLSALLRRMDLIFIAFYGDSDLHFCAGNLYFSNKKNKVMIYYRCRFCLRTNDQLGRASEAEADFCIYIPTQFEDSGFESRLIRTGNSLLLLDLEVMTGGASRTRPVDASQEAFCNWKTQKGWCTPLPPNSPQTLSRLRKQKMVTSKSRQISV